MKRVITFRLEDGEWAALQRFVIAQNAINQSWRSPSQYAKELTLEWIRQEGYAVETDSAE